MSAEAVSLKEHFDLRLSSLREEIVKSEGILELRLSSMNEFRDALKDQASMMATREQLETKEKYLDSRIRSLENSRAYTIGAAAVVAIVMSALVSFIGSFI